MENLLVDHFHTILSEPSSDRSGAIQRITRNIPQLVSRDQNLALMRATTLKEVEEVSKGMAKNKPLGLDAFMVELFQEAWPFLGKDILDVVEESHGSQKVDPALNYTFITIIGKIY